VATTRVTQARSEVSPNMSSNNLSSPCPFWCCILRRLAVNSCDWPPLFHRSGYFQCFPLALCWPYNIHYILIMNHNDTYTYITYPIWYLPIYPNIYILTLLCALWPLAVSQGFPSVAHQGCPRFRHRASPDSGFNAATHFECNICNWVTRLMRLTNVSEV
jgi:hypothetical protein